MAQGCLMVCRLLLLLWTLLMEHPEVSDCSECPPGCSCSFTVWFVRCSNASLSSLPAGFPHATVELDLQFNWFDSLPAASFPSLPDLTTLYLGSSRVHLIELGTFQGVNNLYHLYLDNNLLEEIPAGAFENLTSLVFLHLQRNRITSLSPDAFSSLKRLSVLDLSHNLLVELSDRCLNGLQQLRQLHLSSNLISNISTRALPGSLRTLYLDWNRLKSVPYAICNSVTLSSLHLSGNPIRDLTSLSSGRKLSSLRQLFLENLLLEKNITSSTFKRLRRLEVLSLRNNSLETLPSLSSLKYLSTLHLTGNKWHCDCNLIWLRTWQKKVMKKDRSPVECRSPDALQGQQLVNIELQKLTCPPYQTKSDISSSSANILMASTLPTVGSLSQAATSLPVTVFTNFTTSRITSTIKSTTRNNAATGQTTHSNHRTVEQHDPCLSHDIINISTRTKGSTALLVSWSSSGDHNQFEVWCKSSVDQHRLRVIGGLTEIELHHLQPQTTYKVCIIPQNENLVECVAPTAQQCTSGHTGAPFSSQHNKLALGIGVSIMLFILITMAIFAFYKWRLRPIQFQRHYDEDGPSSQHQGITQSKPTTESIYENLEDGQHVYVTAASQWCEEKIGCTSTTPSRFSSTPTYVSL
ncbi:leucine-rich repeat transmembrane protein FLRT2-like [Pogona vitticeps]